MTLTGSKKSTTKFHPFFADMSYMKLILPLFFFLLTRAHAFEESEGMRAMRLGCDKQKLAHGCCMYAGLLYKRAQTDLAEEYFAKSRKLGNEDSCKKDEWENIKAQTDKEIKETPKEEAPAIKGPAINDALASCKDFSQTYLHPTIHNFNVEEKVLGFRDGGCEYQQTMPNGFISCILNEEQRLNFDGPEKLLDDGKTCQIVTR